MQTKQPLRANSYSVLDDRSFTALLMLIVFLSASFIFSGSALAVSSSVTTHTVPLTGLCKFPNPHCYAIRDWNGHTGGSNTLINPYGALNCQGCKGFIDNEMWFSDKSSSQCTNLPDQACWVEVGISTWPANDPHSCNQGYDSTCAFWADNRPNGGGYHEWPLFYFGADGVDLTPYLFYVTIVNNIGFSSNGSTWDINTNIYQGGNFLTGPDAQSVFPKGSSMNVDHITIGSELTDSGGSAATFYFQYNEWMDGGGNFRYQTNTGTNPSSDPPPNGYWAVNPCNCQGNTGGSFKTYD